MCANPLFAHICCANSSLFCFQLILSYATSLCSSSLACDWNVASGGKLHPYQTEVSNYGEWHKLSLLLLGSCKDGWVYCKQTSNGSCMLQRPSQSISSEKSALSWTTRYSFPDDSPHHTPSSGTLFYGMVEGNPVSQHTQHRQGRIFLW